MRRFLLSFRSTIAFVIGYPTILITLLGCGGGEETAATPAAAEGSGTGEAAAPGMAPPAGMAGSPGMMPGMMPPADGASGSSSAAAGAGAGTPGMPAGYASNPSGMAPGAGYTGAPGDPGAAGYAGAPGYPGAPAGGGIPQVAPRPANFAEWTDQNFLDALREKDPKLLEAIDSKVNAAPGDPKVAQFLTNMLAAMMAVPDANAAGSGAAGGYPGAAGTATMPGGYLPPGTTSAMPPGSAGPGAMVPGSAPAGSAGPGAAPGGASAMPPGAASPGAAMPPQSSLGQPRSNLAYDSVALMLAESATTFLQAPAVGAIASKDIPGSAGAAMPPASSNQLTPPGTMPAGGTTNMPNYAAGQNPGALPQDGAYPGGAYPGGAYPGAAGNTVGGLDQKKLVERIINGLIQNGSSEAWQSLYGIMTQTVKTPLSLSESTELVVRSLYRNIDRNPAMIEPVLLSFVEGTAQISPECRATALQVTASIAAAAADRLTGFDPPAALKGSQGAGAGMGMGMGMTSGAMMPGAGMSSGTVAGESAGGAGYPGMPGMPAAGGTAVSGVSSPESAISETASAQTARFLWSPAFTAALVKQLNASSDLSYGLPTLGGGDFVRIAASVPNSRVRQAVGELFEKCHATGVANLNSAGFFSLEVHDPGMLVTLKSLPRPKPSRAASQQPQTPDSWTSASQDLVLSLRDRMRALSTKPGKLSPVTDSFPVRLHKNAVPEFSGMLTIPGPTSASLKDSAPSPINVYYARTSFTPQRTKDQEDIADHYESRTSGQRRADQGRGILWMDGVKTSASGTKRSLDVIIQAASGNAQGVSGGADFGGAPSASPGAAGGGSGSFTIEILVIDSPEPKENAAKAATEAEK